MNQLDEKVIKTGQLILYPLKAEHAERMFAGLSDLRSYDFTPDVPYNDVAALTERYRRFWSTVDRLMVGRCGLTG
jgi:ribosomal-protein-alanine N-acetyltransferase